MTSGLVIETDREGQTGYAFVVWASPSTTELDKVQQELEPRWDPGQRPGIG